MCAAFSFECFFSPFFLLFNSLLFLLLLLYIFEYCLKNIFALCFYNLFHFYASFRRFDVKPCIKWTSTSTALWSVRQRNKECFAQLFFRENSWNGRPKNKNSFSSLFLLFSSISRLLFSVFGLSIKIPHSLFVHCALLLSPPIRITWLTHSISLALSFFNAANGLECASSHFGS